MAIIEEGQLKGSFRGFRNRETEFEFQGGGTWRQKVYKYSYHYAYMPHARVVDNRGTYEFEVDGMGEQVEVERVR